MWVPTLAGTKHRKYVYAKTEQEAVRKLKELVVRAAQGIPEKEWRLAEYLEYWLEQYAKHRLAPSTYYQYKNKAHLYLVPDLGRRRLSDLSVATLQAYFNSLQDRLSARNIHSIRTTLSAALTAAMREELVMRNVARLVQLPRSERRSIHPWSVEEAGKFLHAAQSDGLFAAFAVLVYCGLRHGEVLGLKWENIDFERGVIHVRQQALHHGTGTTRLARLKTNASVRDLPLLPVPRAALLAHREAQLTALRPERPTEREQDELDRLAFSTSNSTPYEQRVLRRALRKICESHGIRIIKIHHIRHTFATIMKDIGVPARDVQYLLGHASSYTTSQIYQHDDMESRSIQMEKLGQLLERAMNNVTEG